VSSAVAESGSYVPLLGWKYPPVRSPTVKGRLQWSQPTKGTDDCYALPNRTSVAALQKEAHMPRVALNVTAPDFTLPDLNGHPVSLSDFRGRKNVLLVFNRTFV